MSGNSVSICSLYSKIYAVQAFDQLFLVESLKKAMPTDQRIADLCLALRPPPQACSQDLNRFEATQVVRTQFAQHGNNPH